MGPQIDPILVELAQLNPQNTQIQGLILQSFLDSIEQRRQQEAQQQQMQMYAEMLGQSPPQPQTQINPSRPWESDMVGGRLDYSRLGFNPYQEQSQDIMDNDLAIEVPDGDVQGSQTQDLYLRDVSMSPMERNLGQSFLRGPGMLMNPALAGVYYGTMANVGGMPTASRAIQEDNPFGLETFRRGLSSLFR